MGKVARKPTIQLMTVGSYNWAQRKAAEADRKRKVTVTITLVLLMTVLYVGIAWMLWR